MKYLCIILIASVLTACGGGGSGSAGTNPVPSGDNESKAKYAINSSNLEITLDSGTAGDNDASLWAEAISLLPQDILKTEVAEFQIASDGEDGTLAFVGQIDGNETKWLFAIDDSDFNASNLKEAPFVTTMSHEFAHVVALENDQVTAGGTDCAFYEIDEGCALEDSFINKWFETFWVGALFDEHENDVENKSEDEKDEAVAKFFEKYEKSFINEYSATNPVEDFAETFAFFVLQDKSTGTEIKDKKLNFFYDFPELTAIRDHIRSNTTVRK